MEKRLISALYRRILVVVAPYVRIPTRTVGFAVTAETCVAAKLPPTTIDDQRRNNVVEIVVIKVRDIAAHIQAPSLEVVVLVELDIRYARRHGLDGSVFTAIFAATFTAVVAPIVIAVIPTICILAKAIYPVVCATEPTHAEFRNRKIIGACATRDTDARVIGV